MKIIGITGGVGSGKSYVASLAAANFDLLHIQTDNIARRQMAKGGASYNDVVGCFGEEILDENGEIDRKKLALIVFNDREKLERLNSLTHPKVTETVKALIDGARDDFEYVMIETAILKEAGYEKLCDEIWVVRAPVDDRIERVMKTRGYTQERAAATIASQLSDKEFEEFADVIIDNSSKETAESLLERLKQLLN